MLHILFKSAEGQLKREQSLNNILTDATGLAIIDSGACDADIHAACPTGTAGVTLVSN